MIPCPVEEVWTQLRGPTLDQRGARGREKRQAEEVGVWEVPHRLVRKPGIGI